MPIDQPSPSGAARAIVVRPGEGAASPGSPFHYKATADQTHGAFAVLEITHPEGHPGPTPHRHPNEDEAWYVLEGELRFTVEGRSFDAPPGTFVLIPRGLTHTFSNVGRGRSRFLVFLSPPTFAEMFREMGSMPLEALHTKYGVENVEAAEAGEHAR